MNASPGSQGTRGILAAGAGPLLYPGVLGEAIEPSYPAAGSLARLAAGQPRRALPRPERSRSTCAWPYARVPGPPKRVTVP